MTTLDQAINIATSSLRACYCDDGIIAGPHHFTDYWARDGYFAAFGALALGDHHIVAKQLQLFFHHQRPDGLIPYRIMRGPISPRKYMGKPTFYPVPRPTYRLRGYGQPIYDGTTLTLLFASLTNKPEYLSQIKRALSYLESHERYGLLWDGPMAEWNDAIWKWGNLLYSNIIYWYMYDQLARWQSKSDPTWSVFLSTKRDQIATALRSRLWNGQFFADWHDHGRQDYLYPFGNCLAIAWGLTTPLETQSILTNCNNVKTNFSLETNSLAYPWWRVDILNRVMGMSDYQNHSLLWWQPITSYILTLKQTNPNQDIHSQLVKMCQKILQDQTIYECYERDGRPVKRWQYTAEHPFAWASGMLIWALAYNTHHAKS